jgi:hypothetical protein
MKNVKEAAQGVCHHRRRRTNNCLADVEPEVPDCEATGIDMQVADYVITQNVYQNAGLHGCGF